MDKGEEGRRELRAIAGNQTEPHGAYAFRLTQPADWLLFQFEFEKNWTIVLLRDPAGKLRMQFLDCRRPRRVVLHSDGSRSGYATVAGALPAGTWTLEMTGTPGAFRIEWESGCGDAPPTEFALGCDAHIWSKTGAERSACALNLYPWSEMRRADKTWYKGDFHSHTTLSDGRMTPEERMRHAESRGLDFFAATDHNVLPTSWPAGRTLVIPGMEVTSKLGHANAIGLRDWIEWRPVAADGGLGSEEGMNRILADAGRCGALRSINHPMLEPWTWKFRHTKLADIDALEVWNDPNNPGSPQATEQALAIWSAIWNEGYRITGIGGSDAHFRPTESHVPGGPPSLLGDPLTCVRADGLSADSIVRGVRQGRVYVTRGPELVCDIAAAGRSFVFGDDLTQAVDDDPEGKVRYRVAVGRVDRCSVHWIENGKEVCRRTVDGDETCCEHTLHWKNRRYAWVRLEIRADDGALLAFANPVYCGGRKPRKATWEQLAV